MLLYFKARVEELDSEFDADLRKWTSLLQTYRIMAIC